jgi:hypothetical protein
VAVGDFVAEPLGVALDRVSIDLNPVLVLENPFHASERILRGMKQAEINDWFPVVAVLVKQRRHVWKHWLPAVLAPIAAVFDLHVFEAVLGDEDGEHLLFDVVLAVVLVATIGAGTRFSQPRPVVATESILDRFDEEHWNEWIERLFVRVLHTDRHGCTLFTSLHTTAPTVWGQDSVLCKVG